ncbi:EAL domain-containing protein [Rhodocyclus tenuis]|uniref:EAL domain-containing protein n=1 Tax=Rhodocyclus gracilis TaxID=2929842 RepID=A0ABX0WI12_9RHOO|nr:EAL domain-containing protein [Rhodocyclus gracilis]NJA89354.1 EAL domain-containing protein [Rhodocyclus gracilis]
MIHLLSIEDSLADFQLIVRQLKRQGVDATIVRVDDPASLAAALDERLWDAILSDYEIPSLVFHETLALLRQRFPDTPVILVSGYVGEEVAVCLLKDGVWDVVPKDNLSRLGAAIERGLRDAAQHRARRVAEQALQQSEERFRLIAGTITEAIWMANVGFTQFFYVSPAYERIWQRSCASLYQNPRASLDDIHADDREWVMRLTNEAQSAGQTFSLDYRVLRPDGEVRWVTNRGFPVLATGGTPSCYVGVVEDVTERHDAEERLRQAATVFESTLEGVMIAALDGRLLAVNKAFTDISGYSEAEALGRQTNIQRSGRHGDEFYQALWASLLGTGQWHGEIWNRRKNGEVYPAWVNISTVRDDFGRPTHYVGVFSDISQLRRSEEQLAHLAHYDPLTDLPNRLLLQSRLEHALDRAQRHGRRAAALFIDLDFFKTVNDSLGHVVGDRLLIDVAQRLRQRLRDDDTLGRFGGDEFLLLLEPVINTDEAAVVARDVLAILAQPFRLDGKNEVFVGASIGISIFPEDGSSAADLLRGADAAMHQAKGQGRNRFCFYTADMNVQAMAQLELEAALRRALERNEFLLHYQPKVDLRSGRVVGAEALIRWQREGGGLEAPGRFIPLAEKTGLIVAIGTWVIDCACRQLRAWSDDGRPDLRLAVNVSGRQFASGDLADVVTQALARHGVAAAALELELTESMLMEDPEATIATLHALKRIGVKLSLDDFGTGYSSFAYLSRFPIDTLKIDQSFVRNLAAEPEAAMIAVSIIDLAHRMRLKVIAEGVETEAQLDYLRVRECDEMQGYLFARPMPADAFGCLLQDGARLIGSPVA